MTHITHFSDIFDIFLVIHKNTQGDRQVTLIYPRYLTVVGRLMTIDFINLHYFTKFFLILE